MFNYSFILVVAFALYFDDGFLLPSFILWHKGRGVSDILGFCGAWGVTLGLQLSNGLEADSDDLVALELDLSGIRTRLGLYLSDDLEADSDN